MRAALLVVSIVIGGCSAIDSFNFSYANPSDLGGTGGDMTPPPAAFGAACVPNDCMQYNAQRPVTCETTLNGTAGNITFPDGMCTRTCQSGLSSNCSDFGLGAAACTDVDGVSFCLPTCNAASSSTPCRKGYACCANGTKATGVGVCAPANSSTCG